MMNWILRCHRTIFFTKNSAIAPNVVNCVIIFGQCIRTRTHHVHHACGDPRGHSLVLLESLPPSTSQI
jgi:hypothetical protein